MKFDLTEEQRLLAESVRRFTEKDYSFEARRAIVASATGASPEAWKAFADLGLLALPLASDHGGFGGGAVDLAIVMEAFGAALVVEPYVSTVVCARVLERAGPSENAVLLAGVAEGRARLALAHTETQSRYDLASVATRAKRSGDGYVIDGAKRVVLHAPQCDRWIVVARTAGGESDRSGISLFLVDPAAAGVNALACRTIDELAAADVTFTGVQVPAAALVGTEGGGFDLLDEAADFAIALQCAEAVGAMRFACDTTLDYLKTRKQFGVPIGSFQALQHRMVDMVMSLEQASSMARVACLAVDARGDANARRRAVSMAKVRVADACVHVSQEAVQLHGGMGMTEELKVSHTFRRLTMLARQFGDADHHLERLASLPR